MPTPRPWMAYAATGAAATATAVVGGLATDPNSAYYKRLIEPSWQPPPPVFGPVWTALYTDVAVTSGMALNTLGEQGRDREQQRLALALGTNLVLNAGWSWLFFRLRRPWIAAAECAVLTASSADLVRRVGAAKTGAGLALLPYPVWTAFATALTVAIARRNPPRVIEGGPLRRLRARLAWST